MLPYHLHQAGGFSICAFLRQANPFQKIYPKLPIFSYWIAYRMLPAWQLISAHLLVTESQNCWSEETSGAQLLLKQKYLSPAPDLGSHGFKNLQGQRSSNQDFLSLSSFCIHLDLDWTKQSSVLHISQQMCCTPWDEDTAMCLSIELPCKLRLCFPSHSISVFPSHFVDIHFSICPQPVKLAYECNKPISVITSTVFNANWSLNLSKQSLSMTTPNAAHFSLHFRAHIAD